MSLVDYASKPFSAFAKLAGLLRNLPAPNLVFARFVAMLRGNKDSNVALPDLLVEDKDSIEFADSTESGDPAESSVLARTTLDQPVVGPETLRPCAIAEPVAEPKVNDLSARDDLPEREKLIRRRWAETGVRLWNPGLAALNIQGGFELLPAKPGETIRKRDKLEFRLIEGRIVCEGVAVDPPTRKGSLRA